MYLSPYGAKPSATPFGGGGRGDRPPPGINPLTGLNLLQPQGGTKMKKELVKKVAIPLRG